MVTTKPEASVVVAALAITSAAPTDSAAIARTNEISSLLEVSRWGIAVLRLRGKGLFLSRMLPKGTAPWGLQPLTAK